MNAKAKIYLSVFIITSITSSLSAIDFTRINEDGPFTGLTTGNSSAEGMNITATDCTFTTFAPISGSNITVQGDLNVYLKDTSIESNLTYIVNCWDNNAPSAAINGNLSFTLNGGTLSGGLRIGTNSVGGADLINLIPIKGDITAVIGGYYNSLNSQYVASSTPTAIGAFNNSGVLQSIMMTGGRCGGAEGNANLTIVSGTIAGIIVMGPNAATLGSASNPGSGNTNLNIMGGEFNGAIYAGSHCQSSTNAEGTILGNANLTLSGGTFHRNIYVGAVGSDFLNFHKNNIRGSANGTITGNLDNIHFDSGVIIYAGNADQGKVFNFTDASGTMGASLSGFDVVKINVDSSVVLASSAAITTGRLEFYADSLTQHGLLTLAHSALTVGESFDIILADSFTANDGDFLQLINITDATALTQKDVLLKHKNGSNYDGAWEAVFDSNSFGIRFLGPIPEPSTYAVSLGLLSIALVSCRRKRQ